MQPIIPDKTYFKIGEVANLAGINASVLRYWETEFRFLKPEKSSSGQRLYTRQNIETVLKIKQLLYTEKYTIEGVRKLFSPRHRLAHQADKDPPLLQGGSAALLKELREELLLIRELLA